MVCQLCNAKIGAPRRWFDAEFCSAAHRRLAKTRSARSLRAEKDWLDLVSGGLDASAPSRASGAGTCLILTIVLSGVLLTAMQRYGTPHRSTEGAGESINQVFRALANALPTNRSLEVHDDFKAGWGQWTAAGKGSEWTYAGGFVRPGRLRIWDRTSPLSDYQFEFVGQIEHHGMSWVYRAANQKNYYAMKVLLTRPGPLATADLLRFAVINGREQKRTRLPLPLTVRLDQPYRIQLEARGSQFTTRIDGSIVDTWSDSRLAKGGVGFFADRGEQASVRWASVTELNHGGSLFSAALPCPLLMP